MTNWREMEAGPELDRLIAERLGWTRIEKTDYWLDDYYGSQLVECYEGYPPDRRYETLVPAYSTDLNTALALVERRDGFMLERDAESDLWIAHLDTLHPLCEQADTPALAICRSWLAWQEIPGSRRIKEQAS